MNGSTMILTRSVAFLLLIIPYSLSSLAGNMLASLDVLKSLKIERYDHEFFDQTAGSGYRKRGELDCDGESDCCWQNAQPKTDQLEWVLGTGDFDRSSFKTVFQTDKFPSKNFIFVAALYPEKKTYNAKLISCPIRCTDETVQVTINHWRSEGVDLQICQRESFFDTPWRAPITHCTVIPRQQTPGPSMVELPPGEAFEIVIQASNMSTLHGSFAFIDNIRVDFTPCKFKPKTIEESTRPPAPASRSTGSGSGAAKPSGQTGGSKPSGQNGGNKPKPSGQQKPNTQTQSKSQPCDDPKLNDCQMLCFPASNRKGYKCGCETGFKLLDDRRTCDLDFGDFDYSVDIRARRSPPSMNVFEEIFRDSLGGNRYLCDCEVGFVLNNDGSTCSLEFGDGDDSDIYTTDI